MCNENITKLTIKKMNSINIVFFDCCSVENPEVTFKDGIQDDYTVNFLEKISVENIKQEISEICLTLIHKYSITNIQISFVDVNYSKYFYETKEGQDFFNIISQMAKLQFEEIQNVEFNDCSALQFMKNFELLDDVVYFFCSFNRYDNSYHFLNYLQIPANPNVFIAFEITKWKDVLSSICPFDVFSGQSPEESFDCFGMPRTVNLSEIKWVLQFGVNQTEYFKKSGFLDRSEFIQYPIPPCFLNVESFIFSSSVIIRYKLIPPTEYLEDKEYCKQSPQEEFCESADYRYLLTDIMCRILAKQCLNFNVVNEIDNWQTLKFKRLIKRLTKLENQIN